MTFSTFGAVVISVLVASSVSPARSAAETSAFDRLEPSVRAAVSQIVTAAAKDSLPTRPLVAKALEGASKGASGERIVSAVKAYADALRKARGAIGPRSTEAEIVAAASAIQAGVPGDTLSRLRSARPHDSLVVPLVVLSDMVARRVPVQVASLAVVASARAGASDSDLFSIRERVEKDIQAGVPPATAADQQTKAWLSAQLRSSTRGKAEPKTEPPVPSSRKTKP